MVDSRQAGFSLISVLVAVAIIAVMASIAVPKFTTTIMTANTAKVQSDLSTLDAAIAVFQLEKGREPLTLDELKDYVSDIGSLKPPKGKCMLKDGTILTLENEQYGLRKGDAKGVDGARAICAEHTAGEFGNAK